MPAIRQSETFSDMADNIDAITRTIDDIATTLRAMITGTYIQLGELTGEDAVYVKESIENTLGQLKDMIDGAKPYLFGTE